MDAAALSLHKQKKKTMSKLKRDTVTGLDIAKEDLKESIFKGLERPKKSISPKKTVGTSGGKIKEEEEEQEAMMKKERKATAVKEEKKVEPLVNKDAAETEVTASAASQEASSAPGAAASKKEGRPEKESLSISRT